MISEHLAGGDCLNVGCVPSKALLHCARLARQVRAGVSEGLLVGMGDEPHAAARLDFAKVMSRMRRLRAQIAPADSHEATVAAGADVFQGRGRFVGPNTIEVNGRALRFKCAVIATGGRASVPAGVEGLAEAPYLTNATLFNLTTLPPRLVVLGAGAVGLEMAQAFACFGSTVTVLARSTPLSGETEAAGAAVRDSLTADGVRFVCNARVTSVHTLGVSSDGELPLMRVTCSSPDDGGAPLVLECEALLVATGRTPNVDGLGLEAAGVRYTTERGVEIDDLAATSNPRVYAVGDCAAGVPRFTHMSGEMAKLVVQNALFDDKWRLSTFVVPRCVYTDPEVACVGMSRPEADSKGLAVDAYTTALAHNDRAILDGDASGGGFVEVLCKKGTDTIVGATAVAPHAGDMISELTLAMKAGIGLEAVGRVIHPYPTASEAVMGCGLGYVRAHWAKMSGLKRKEADR